jgi:hypothetical protein
MKKGLPRSHAPRVLERRREAHAILYTGLDLSRKRVGMLLCLSSRCWWVLEESVEVAGEVALEAAGCLAAALSLADSPLDVVDGWSVHSPSGEDDLVECAVELSVAAAVESVADRLAG